MQISLISYYKFLMMVVLLIVQGRTVDFRNTVIIMTSNLGAKALHKNSSELGFLALKI